MADLDAVNQRTNRGLGLDVLGRRRERAGVRVGQVFTKDRHGNVVTGKPDRRIKQGVTRHTITQQGRAGNDDAIWPGERGGIVGRVTRHGAA